MKNVPAPYEHQQEAFEFTSNKDAFALFMEQGTGKSKVTIMKAEYLYHHKDIDRVLVICPNALKDQWVDEQFEEHYPGEFEKFVWNGLKTKRDKIAFDNFCKPSDKLKVFTINVEAFQASTIDLYLKLFCNQSKDVFIVVDESTRIKNPDAKRTKKILKGFNKRKYKAILTGTPTPNSPFDIYSQFDFLYNNYFKMSYFYFKHHYGIMMKVRYKDNQKDSHVVIDKQMFNTIKNCLNRVDVIDEQYIDTLSIKYNLAVKNILMIKKMGNFSPYKNLNELNNKIDPITFKVMKKDCLDLPDKVYEKLIVELGPEQKKIYKDLQKQMIAQYEGRELSVTNKAVLCMRLQMVTGGNFPYPVETLKRIMKDGEELLFSKIEYKTKPIKNNPKVKAILEDLEEVSNDTSIIIWSPFVAELFSIYNNLKDKYSCELYYGGTKSIDRKEIIENFKQKKFRILIMNPMTGREGLNLQVSTLQYFYSNSFKADDRLQAEDRSHRIGQENKVTYKDLICNNTVDQRVYEVLREKKDMIDFFRDKSISEIIF